MENTMKLTQQQITRANQILSDLERKVEEMEQKDYMTYDPYLGRITEPSGKTE